MSDSQSLDLMSEEQGRRRHKCCSASFPLKQNFSVSDSQRKLESARSSLELAAEGSSTVKASLVSNRDPEEKLSRDTSAQVSLAASEASLAPQSGATSDSIAHEVVENCEQLNSPSVKSDSSCAGATLKQPTSKQFQKFKYEIDHQSFVVKKIDAEIRLKTERGFPSPCLHNQRIQLSNETKKLNEMVKCAMEEQAKCRGKAWDTIPLSNLSASRQQRLKPPKTPSGISKISAFTCLNLSDALLTDNETLESDRYKLQQELLCKDDTLQAMEEKLQKLQCQLLNILHDNKNLAMKTSASTPSSKSSVYECESKSKLKSVIDNTDKLKCNIKQIESKLCELRHEMNSLRNERKVALEFKETPSCVSFDTEPTFINDSQTRPKTCPCDIGENLNASKLKHLQSQYGNLQTEYCRKEKECEEMAQRMKKFIDECGNDKERAENQALKARADEMVAELGDYKVFIKELQQQVDTYREKFMKGEISLGPWAFMNLTDISNLTAQEKVEHQRYMLESLEVTSSEVEARINSEVTRIKEKFQEKLAELCPYPQKYQEAKVELEDSKEKIDRLEKDLKTTLSVLCKSKSELKALKQQPDESLEKKYKKLQCEVEMMKAKYCGIKATKECLEEKLGSMKAEIESLRKDSAKIITTTKCCADKNRQILNQHINGLEIDLAQCRASAAMSVAEKEEIISKMKSELAALCGHFNDCQGQIKQLKNHVTYLTNQRHKIRPGDLFKIDLCSPEC